MLNDICKVFSPSGNEEEMGKYLMDSLNGVFDEISRDTFGNYICKKGNGGILIECGMDVCGIMIVSADDKKAHFAGVGGINSEYLIGKKILFKDGRRAVVRYDGNTPGESKISDLYLEGEISQLKTGDFGIVKCGFFETETEMFGNGLGNRIGISVVIEALKKAKELKNITVLFSAQKRLGGRGIQAFFGDSEFDNVITVDTVDSGSLIKKGDGCGLAVADKTSVCKGIFKARLEEIADLENIKRVLVATDDNLLMGNIATTGKGVNCAGLVVPVSNKNKNFECVNKSDFNEAVKFLTALMENF